MPDTRGRPLPSEILDTLKDPTITQWLRTFVLNQQSVASIGRYPGIGSAQNDTYAMIDSCDATHPLNLDYVIPHNFQRIISARLTIILRAYRAYVSQTSSSNNSFVQATGTTNFLVAQVLSAPGQTTSLQSADHTHADPQGGVTGTGPTDHTHNYTGVAANPSSAAGLSNPTFANALTSVGLIYGINEGATATGVTISFDGVDQTSALGGPFNANQIELDVTKYISQAVATLHTIALQPTGLGRIHGILRLSYYADSRLPQ